jgi:hypothetical protein
MKIRKLVITVILSILLMSNVVYGQDDQNQMSIEPKTEQYSNYRIEESIPSEFNTKAEMEKYFKTSIEMKKDEKGDIYLYPPYDASSRDGYEPLHPTRRSSLMRVRSAKRNPNMSGPITNITHVITIPIGKTVTLDQTIHISRTDTFSATASTGMSIKLSEKILATINNECGYEQSRTFSYTINKGETYVFPPKYESSYDFVKYYIGFDHDWYDVIIDYVPLKEVINLIEYKSISYSQDPNTPQYFTIHFKDGRRRNVYSNSLDDLYRNNTEVKDGVRYYKQPGYSLDYDNIITEYGVYKIPVPVEFPIPGKI